MVGVAELFDKTWFMGLLLALRHSKVTVFAGSITALFLHTLLAAALGYAFAQMLSRTVLSFMTVALFTIFAIMYFKDAYFADSNGDAIEDGKKEAAEDCGEISDAKGADVSFCEEKGKKVEEELEESTDSVQSSQEDVNFLQQHKEEMMVFGKAFVAIFIAEWGDRTQIAMIGQHASQPLVPVLLGSALAFVVLTLSAVMAASLLGSQKLSSRLIYGISAACFLVFAILALRDAFVSMEDQSDAHKA